MYKDATRNASKLTTLSRDSQVRKRDPPNGIMRKVLLKEYLTKRRKAQGKREGGQGGTDYQSKKRGRRVTGKKGGRETGQNTGQAKTTHKPAQACALKGARNGRRKKGESRVGQRRYRHR